MPRRDAHKFKAKDGRSTLAMKVILLVDDDAQILKVLQRALRPYAARWQVIAATDGRKAIEIARRMTVDVVVTDLMMPGRDGMEAIGEIRRAQPLTKIVAMTGGGFIASKEMLHVAELLGAHAVLGKPFELDKFISTIEGLLAMGDEGISNDCALAPSAQAPTERARDQEPR